MKGKSKKGEEVMNGSKNGTKKFNQPEEIDTYL